MNINIKAPFIRLSTIRDLMSKNSSQKLKQWERRNDNQNAGVHRVGDEFVTYF